MAFAACAHAVGRHRKAWVSGGTAAPPGLIACTHISAVPFVFLQHFWMSSVRKPFSFSPSGGVIPSHTHPPLNLWQARASLSSSARS